MRTTEVYRRALQAARTAPHRPMKAAHDIFWWSGYGYASRELSKLVIHHMMWETRNGKKHHET